MSSAQFISMMWNCIVNPQPLIAPWWQKAPVCIFNRPFLFESQEISLCLWPSQFRNWKQCWCNPRNANAAGRGEIHGWRWIKRADCNKDGDHSRVRWQQTAASAHRSSQSQDNDASHLYLQPPPASFAGRWLKVGVWVCGCVGMGRGPTAAQVPLHDDRENCQDLLRPICICFCQHALHLMSTPLTKWEGCKEMSHIFSKMFQQ